MAWITEKNSGCLVRWRENGRLQSKYFAASEREAAEEFEAGRDREAEVRRILHPRGEKIDFDNPTFEQLADPEWQAAYRRRGLPEADDDPEFALAVYLRRVIEDDPELRDASRYTYERGVKNHIADTRLGRTQELGGTSYFEPQPPELSDWMPTDDHFTKSKAQDQPTHPEQ